MNDLESTIEYCRKMERLCSQDYRVEKKQGLPSDDTLLCWGLHIALRLDCEGRLNDNN